jgi:eukaryotic-like serine/threonine-protein kinase
MQTGQLLCNRYRIEKHLAGGAFGQTYLAVDTHLPSHQQVVVKLLKPSSNDPVMLQLAQRLFDMEAATLETLGKDNDRIPSLYAYFELGGEFYLVQEFIAGTTLTKELQGRKLSESETLAILQEILTGLSTVHAKNLIHRDLKPDNIIRRDSDRKLVLIDFGAVKQVRSATVNTMNSESSRTIGIGTDGYMPSEQGLGYPKPASDVYAVGAIGIQCLTGSRPLLLFNENSLTIEWQHLQPVDRDVAKVLNRMVAPDYRQRYANATEALIAIESLISPPTPSPIKPLSPLFKTRVQLRESFQLPIKKAPLPRARRKFLLWLGFGAVGVGSGFALSQIGANSPSNNTVTTTNSPAPATSRSPSPTGPSPSAAVSNPQLTKIEFTSIKLDNKGEIIDRPAGSAEIFTESLGNGVELTMVKIPPGKFLMGLPASEQERLTSERKRLAYFSFSYVRELLAQEIPQHQVSLPEFYIGQTLITQAQWRAIMGNNPSRYKGNDKLPVEQVNWLDGMDFCQKLSQKTGRTYQLPSEAQWEYACRAGTTTPFAFGETITPTVVNYDGDYPSGGAAKGENRQKTTPVGSFPPNLFGLYDLHGNLREWCLDEWVSSYRGAPSDGSARGDINSRDEKKNRLLRGGSWFGHASDCRAASRYFGAAHRRTDLLGFRVVSVPSRTS